MSTFKPQSDNFEPRTRAGFAAQPMMTRLGIEIDQIEAGAVTLTMPFDAAHTQHHGFLHGGAYTTMMDSAAGFSAMTLMADGEEPVTAELKTTFLRPARGTHFRAEGRVIKPGRTLYFTACDCFAIDGDKEVLIAQMTATMMAVSY